ncbi:FAD:protein FMN transferase [Metabacillus sp. RGM 3146]|uniref:FAD:protein FMN transferase n=1 Tax=Metabacillus sp. RGM 3146 TaxID=3401092 RepID=UPI003B9AEEA3
MRNRINRETFTKMALYMDTTVSIKVVSEAISPKKAGQAIQRAFKAFRHVEQICSRFTSDSEVMSLIQRIGEPVRVSDTLFEAVRFSLEVASVSSGAFDPTVGAVMESYGFNRHYMLRTRQETGLPREPVSYKDVLLDEENRTITLQKPLILDLGAVAKGLAIDLAAMELHDFEGFLIDAGGDLYAGGFNERGEKWKVGIRHPQRKQEIIGTVELSNEAICTSGNYERRSPSDPSVHHLFDPKNQKQADGLVSCTATAPFAMMADAFSTAAFILGAEKGMVLIKEAELEGVLITPSLTILSTERMEAFLNEYI